MLLECGYWSVPDKPCRTPPQPAETKNENNVGQAEMDKARLGDTAFTVTIADINTCTLHEEQCAGKLY
jgi:hypothetical protein